MTAVTADYPGREETQDPLVCMTKSALHGNRRVAGGETAGSSSHCRQQSQQAAPIAGSCHCRQQPLQAGRKLPCRQQPLQAAPTTGSSLTRSTHCRQPSFRARLCSCASDGKPPKCPYSRLVPQQTFTNKLKEERNLCDCSVLVWWTPTARQLLCLAAASPHGASSSAQHVPAPALEANGIWIYDWDKNATLFC